MKTPIEYDGIKHARILVRDSGICDAPIGCNVCFRKTAGKPYLDCTPEIAYKDAVNYLKENDNRGRCVSLW